MDARPALYSLHYTQSTDVLCDSIDSAIASLIVHYLLGPLEALLDARFSLHSFLLNIYIYEYSYVQVIFHPEFLSRVSPVIALDYEEFVRTLVFLMLI